MVLFVVFPLRNRFLSLEITRNDLFFPLSHDFKKKKKKNSVVPWYLIIFFNFLNWNCRFTYWLEQNMKFKVNFLAQIIVVGRISEKESSQSWSSLTIIIFFTIIVCYYSLETEAMQHAGSISNVEECKHSLL